MISSSNFFKKTFFTVEPQEQIKQQDNHYAPWHQNQHDHQKLRKKSHRYASIQKPHSSIQNYQSLQKNRRESPALSMDRRLLISEKSIILSYEVENKNPKESPSFSRKLIERKGQINLPIIHSKTKEKKEKKKIVNLEDDLNFIRPTENKMKKLNLNRSFETNKAPPSFEIYKRCLIAARKLILGDAHKNPEYFF